LKKIVIPPMKKGASMGWPTIPYKPKNPGPSDQTLEEMLIDLERLNASGFLRIITHGGERGYHIKLVLDDKRLVSLYAWNDKFLQGKTTIFRSYGVWPLEALEIDENKGDKVIAEGCYTLQNGLLALRLENSGYGINSKELVYRLKLARVREYASPKHGWSVRPEYYAIPQNRCIPNSSKKYL